MPNLRVTGRSSLEDARCAICHDALGGASAATCARCQSAFHDDCRVSLGRCPTLGCVEPAPAAPRVHEPEPRLRWRFGIDGRLILFGIVVIPFIATVASLAFVPPRTGPGGGYGANGEDEARRLEDEAVERFDRGDIDGAAEAARASLEHARLPRARAVLAAHALLVDDRPALAASDLEEVSASIDNPLIYTLLGAARLRLGNVNGALAALDRALWARTTDPRSWALRAATLLEWGDPAGALTDATRALAIDARHGWIWAIRGEAWRRLDNDVQALLDLDNALRLDPDLAWALRARARVHEARGDADEAARDLARAARVRSANPFARTVLERR